MTSFLSEADRGAIERPGVRVKKRDERREEKRGEKGDERREKREK